MARLKLSHFKMALFVRRLFCVAPPGLSMFLPDTPAFRPGLTHIAPTALRRGETRNVFGAPAVVSQHSEFGSALFWKMR